jgi:hypothetical protein
MPIEDQKKVPRIATLQELGKLETIEMARMWEQIFGLHLVMLFQNPQGYKTFLRELWNRSRPIQEGTPQEQIAISTRHLIVEFFAWQPHEFFRGSFMVAQ